MNTLIELLKANTESLKVQYLKLTEKWAGGFYDLQVEKRKWTDADWCNVLGVEPFTYNKGTRGEFVSFPRGFFGTRQARTFDGFKRKMSRVLSKTKAQFIELELKKALDHYEDSIDKLAYRIIKKGLNTETITVRDSSIGLNINTTISDGVKTVKAWTILAQGEINAPHYRYLIK